MAFSYLPSSILGDEHAGSFGRWRRNSGIGKRLWPSRPGQGGYRERGTDCAKLRAQCAGGNDYPMRRPAVSIPFHTGGLMFRKLHGPSPLRRTRASRPSSCVVAHNACVGHPAGSLLHDDLANSPECPRCAARALSRSLRMGAMVASAARRLTIRPEGTHC